MRRNNGTDAKIAMESRSNGLNLLVLLQEFVDGFIGYFYCYLQKIVGSAKKGIEKDVEKNNENKSHNGFKRSMIGSLEDMPPERKRTDPNSEKKRNCEKHKNFFHVKPPLTFGV